MSINHPGRNGYNYDDYDYHIVRSEKGNRYRGLCTEFPEAAKALGATPNDALELIKFRVKQLADEYEEAGLSAPEPLSLQKFSGSLAIQVTPEVHRRLAIEAMKRDARLDEWITSKLMVEYSK